MRHEAYVVPHPHIQYHGLVPVSMDAYEWTPSITYYSTDITGSADWMSGDATSFAVAETTKQQHQVQVHMANIGYRYSMEELGVAMMIPGIQIPAEKAIAARRVYEEFVDRIVLYGDGDRSWDGLINNGSVPRVDASRLTVTNGKLKVGREDS